VTSLSVVVPATDAPATLDECIQAIEAAVESPGELIVVDAPRGAGPAAARNAGARRSSGDVIVFVDSDVAVHPDAFARIRAAFASDPTLTALFGSYDDDPRAGGVVSDFRNLLHHHVHQTSAGPATTFWAGLGAVRREAFDASGGFDERTFPQPSIEDIDLGMRLVDQGGRIVLDPLLQGKHLKRWTLAGMIDTDFAARGVPWVTLLLRRGSASTALNLGWRHRTTAVASLALLIALARKRLPLSAGLLVLIITLNQSFYRLLLRQRGAAVVAAGLPLHIVHHLVGVAALPAGARRHLLARRSRRTPGGGRRS
jgi:glycosyltransferase involved in cell wall biosynthesis